MNQQTNITWDQGSAYDLFVSLRVLHQPEDYGLRPSWAAGVRSRLTGPRREILAQSQAFLPIPLAWLQHLPPPKNAASALSALADLPPEDRLPALTFGKKDDQESAAFRSFLLSLEGKQRLSASIESRMKSFQSFNKKASKSGLRACFEAWRDRRSFGINLLDALEAYVQSFFTEEEPRIHAAQSKALTTAKSLVAEKGILSALEELSAGVRMDWALEVNKLILAPSFWGAPFVFFDTLDPDTGVILFGARLQGSTLVPGELVPEDLLAALKALADPTRLRILRYLQSIPSTPSDLAKVLRLRPPTVIHHLHSLRLAGLVRVTVSQEGERRYAARTNSIETTFQNLQAFIQGE